MSDIVIDSDIIATVDRLVCIIDENDVLKKENDVLKKENDVLKNGLNKILETLKSRSKL